MYQSAKQKVTLTIIHLMATSVAIRILLNPENNFIYSIFGAPEIESPLISRAVVLVAGSIYFIRLCITSFVFLKRKMPWKEVLEVGLFVAFIQIFFAILTLYNKSDFSLLDFLGIGLFLFGSYLNTASEGQRMAWKKKPDNKGKLYSKGLFKYAMHINYFGDTISFTAFALLTGCIWAFSIPLIMTLGFIFIHIPKLDRYLNEKYKTEFDDYSNRTKKFIPWIY